MERFLLVTFFNNPGFIAPFDAFTLKFCFTSSILEFFLHSEIGLLVHRWFFCHKFRISLLANNLLDRLQFKLHCFLKILNIISLWTLESTCQDLKLHVTFFFLLSNFTGYFCFLYFNWLTIWIETWVTHLIHPRMIEVISSVYWLLLLVNRIVGSHINHRPTVRILRIRTLGNAVLAWKTLVIVRTHTRHHHLRALTVVHICSKHSVVASCLTLRHRFWTSNNPLFSRLFVTGIYMICSNFRSPSWFVSLSTHLLFCTHILLLFWLVLLF
jgi:hypothetical protein